MFNFSTLSIPLLLLFFGVAAGAVWVAGIYLSNATDALSKRFGLGEALGGLIVLAIVTNLPEIAITVSGALHNKVEIAVGNILGGIALQTVVLVLLDIFGVGRPAPLMYQAASLTLVLSGVLVIVVLTLVVMGHQFPASVSLHGLTPAGGLILISWLVGVYLVGKSSKTLPWVQQDPAPEAPKKSKQDDTSKQDKTGRNLLIFGVGALVTLLGGVVLEGTGDAIASHIGMSGVLFGATVLAASTSLPEVSTGLAAIKLGDYELAVSDIFGGNAFLPVLLPVAALISGKAVLPVAGKADIYLTGVGMLLTCMYLYGLIFRPKRQILYMGIDSFVVLLTYILSLAGLFLVVQH